MNNVLSISEQDIHNLVYNNNLKVSVELVSPESAHNYLQRNFCRNRSITGGNVSKLALAMQKGSWSISTDCIGFDTRGRLINGQHRLTAVINTKTSQPFIVVRNLPVQSAQIIDVGKKRTMDERLCIGGKDLSKLLCSVVRNSMTVYTDNHVGTAKYSEQHHDSVVYSMYEKHAVFFDILEDLKLLRPSFFAAAAAKMYTEMRYQNLKRNLLPEAATYSHGMGPLDRAIHFVELTLQGGSERALTNFAYDTAAVRLKGLYDMRRSQNKHWNTISEYRLSVTAAFAFMVGKPIKSIRPAQTDPFRSFVSLPATSPT